MDLVHGAKQIIVMLTHYSKGGDCKLLKRCDLPLTGMQVVHKVATNLGIFEVTGTQFRILELADGVSKDHLGLAPELLC